MSRSIRHLRTALRAPIPRPVAAVPRFSAPVASPVSVPSTLRSTSLARSFASSARVGASSTPHGDPAVDPSIVIRDLTDSEYHALADEDMDTLHEGLEVLCEEYAPSTDWEVEYSSGVMTLTIPPHGTYVINKQPPNHQIWVSSPISGPARFSMSPDGVWVHHRIKGVQLGKLLEGELREFLAQANAGEGWEGVGLK